VYSITFRYPVLMTLALYFLPRPGHMSIEYFTQNINNNILLPAMDSWCPTGMILTKVMDIYLEFPPFHRVSCENVKFVSWELIGYMTDFKFFTLEE
jgi:hypothetical protein